MRWVIRLLFVLAVSISSPVASRAGEADLPRADRQAIRQVIDAQMQAFQRDDGKAAFAHASPMIQQMFGTPEFFMTMVRQGYQPVYRPREVEFREIVEFRGEPTQTVFVVGPDGGAVVALYKMQKQPDGSWRINGCILTDVDDRTT